MNLLTAGRKALIARLSTITQVNGYRTNAGLNVRTGWFNEVVDSRQVTYPVIVVQKAADDKPTARAQGLRKLHGLNVVAGVEAGLDDYEDALMTSSWT